jgi:hypothetical protein
MKKRMESNTYRGTIKVSFDSNNRRNLLMDLIKLPKEIYEALEHYKGFDDILYNLERMSSEAGNTGNPKLRKIYEYYKSNPQDYFRALVNGYKVESSPEEQAVELYKSARHEFKMARRDIDAEYYKGRKHGIEDVLTLFGIKYNSL